MNLESNLHYLAYDEVGITIAVIAAALAFVVLVWNAVKAIHDWRQMARKPTDDIMADHERRIAALEECCEEVTGKLSADWQFQQTQAEVNRMVLESLKALLQHAVDGNDTESLEANEQRIDKFLFDHMR